jgi:hypothetical protein
MMVYTSRMCFSTGRRWNDTQIGALDRGDVELRRRLALAVHSWDFHYRWAEEGPIWCFCFPSLGKG